VGAWGVGFSDRVLRFVGTSAVMHALFAPFTYWLWREFVKTGRVQSGEVPLLPWLVVLAYVGFPIVAGSLVGLGTIRKWDWVKYVTGPAPAPRAWDHLFSQQPDGWIRLRLNSGTWLGGAYAERPDGWKSYAAGYPEEQDLFLVEAAEVDPHTGEFLFDEEDNPILRDSSLLIRWSEDNIWSSSKGEADAGNSERLRAGSQEQRSRRLRQDRHDRERWLRLGFQEGKPTEATA
jgi:hypothetical protein